ncbi:hypothetical protein PF005_g23850 [Phytophthora fragariae]|uniref:Uncharacterized protein n=2 Tax=Phytophthora TaxID=4783 RepID=A0A6A3DTI6_9STRA|nr:hypothetical protein PF003_g16172 [Phytophthora fragariae]KAE9011017.1 hypothetical protein PR002_g15207 [Phytophthora rubi]KAE8925162.1 hypothetical protein PF009_g24620 [Phytophthora fragariae]KAE8979841.1 hypothetical protein PF011_g22680 [Phytophthora fragariae]KAE9015849.1 hypothetical protein PR001_g14796 [Phytophthora rubi]
MSVTLHLWLLHISTQSAKGVLCREPIACTATIAVSPSASSSCAKFGSTTISALDLVCRIKY